ncbi:MAG: BofC C-terminal domain-containing protein [Deltaproteobacteria bacterium]
MIRKYPPNRMFGMLVVLLAMAVYFSYDLYINENRHNTQQIHFKGSASPEALPQKITPKAIPPASNTEVEGSRPEDVLISPNAIIVIEKKYTRCGHVISNTINVPADMVNLTESQLKLAFKNYKVTKFSPEKIIILKELEMKCSNHFILKEKDGFVAVYYQQPINGILLKEVTPLLVKNLPEKEKSRLKQGLKVESQQELAQTLEDLGS